MNNRGCIFFNNDMYKNLYDFGFVQSAAFGPIQIKEIICWRLDFIQRTEYDRAINCVSNHTGSRRMFGPLVSYQDTPSFSILDCDALGHHFSGSYPNTGCLFTIRR